MTLSIVAREPTSGLLGCAVTSCAIAAGRRVLHARAGVGVAVAQASSTLRWGDDLLDAVACGIAPDVAVAALSNAENQLALVDARGGVAAHTGNRCEAFAGHLMSDGVSAQANMAVRPDAWSRMIDAYLASSAPFAERLIAALAASGGDRRGHQGAAVIVTGATPGEELTGSWHEPHLDLRVDDHRSPVDELARLLSLHRAHNEMRRVADLVPAQRIAALEPLIARHPDDPHLLASLRAATEESRGL